MEFLDRRICDPFGQGFSLQLEAASLDYCYAAGCLHPLVGTGRHPAGRKSEASGLVGVLGSPIAVMKGRPGQCLHLLVLPLPQARQGEGKLFW